MDMTWTASSPYLEIAVAVLMSVGGLIAVVIAVAATTVCMRASMVRRSARTRFGPDMDCNSIALDFRGNADDGAGPRMVGLVMSVRRSTTTGGGGGNDPLSPPV